MIRTRPPSSMRAALNSRYSMRAFLRARELNKAASFACQDSDFTYKEGEHVYASSKGIGAAESKSYRMNISKVTITRTPNGKRWSVPSMEVELNKDVIEVRDGLGKIVDAVVLSQRKKA